MDSLANPYWASRGDEDAHGLAYAEIDHVIRRGGREAVELLEELAAAAPDTQSLRVLGAGPFEDLVKWHGLSLAAQLDAAMDREPKLRRAVEGLRVGIEELDEDVNFVRFFGLT